MEKKHGYTLKIFANKYTYIVKEITLIHKCRWHVTTHMCAPHRYCFINRKNVI